MHYDKQEIEGFEVEVVDKGLMSQPVIVKCEEDCSFWRQNITALKGLKKQVDDRRKGIVKPLNEAKAEVQALFNPMLAKIDSKIKEINDPVVAYVRAEAEKQRVIDEQKAKELAELEKKQEKTVDISESIAIDVKKTELEKPTETVKVKGMTTYYSVEVTDKTQLPMEYLIPDTIRLNKIASALKKDFKIAGCKLVTRQVLKG